MLKKISLEVDMPWESHYPVRTGPEFETVKGFVEEIHLASGKVTINNVKRDKFWVISLEDAFTKNIHLQREDD